MCDGKAEVVEQQTTLRDRHDPHLQSVNEVVGYDVFARDDVFGRVADFVIDTQSWTISHFLLSTGSGLQRKKPLVSPLWFTRINWEKERIVANFSREIIMKDPNLGPVVGLHHADDEAQKVS